MNSESCEQNAIKPTNRPDTNRVQSMNLSMNPSGHKISDLNLKISYHIKVNALSKVFK